MDNQVSTPERSDGIIQYPKPAMVVELERFLGIVAYFYCFIHHAASKSTVQDEEASFTEKIHRTLG